MSDPLREALDVLVKWLVAGYMRGTVNSEAEQEASAYLVSGKAERALAALVERPGADCSGAAYGQCGCTCHTGSPTFAPSSTPSTPDAPIHRHAPDALCVPSWCPVGAAEVARKQERERWAAAVEGLSTWPRVCWYAYDARVRGVSVNPTEDRVVVDLAAVLSILRETEA